MRALAIALIGTALLAASLGRAAAQQDRVVSAAVWADFQTYRLMLGPTGTGFYAVTDSGAGGRGIWCKRGLCGQPPVRSEAIKNCEAINPGSTCIIFAVNQDIVVPYDMAP